MIVTTISTNFVCVVEIVVKCGIVGAVWSLLVMGYMYPVAIDLWSSSVRTSSEVQILKRVVLEVPCLCFDRILCLRRDP